MCAKQSRSDPFIEDLVNLVLLSLNERSNRNGLAEDLQSYVCYLRNHIYHDPLIFEERFSKGYHALLQMLDENQV